MDRLTDPFTSFHLSVLSFLSIFYVFNNREEVRRPLQPEIRLRPLQMARPNGPHRTAAVCTPAARPERMSWMLSPT